MKIVILSDHAGDKAQEAQARRQADYDSDLKIHEDATRARRQRKDNYLAQLRTAWRDRRWWAVATSAMTCVFGSLPHVPGRPVLRSADREEIVWKKGSEGEKRVRDFLAGRLGDEWILILGYMNPKGEVDQILVGPSGVFAFEIKFVNGVVYCRGDRWWRDKYDRYGNCVEKSLPIADKRGRGPSRQLNESADSLQQFLSRRIGEVRIRRAIVFSHDSSEIGDTADLTVDLVTTLAAWDVRSFLGATTVLDGPGVARIVDAVRQDHGFHERRFRSQKVAPDTHQVSESQAVRAGREACSNSMTLEPGETKDENAGASIEFARRFFEEADDRNRQIFGFSGKSLRRDLMVMKVVIAGIIMAVLLFLCVCGGVFEGSAFDRAFRQEPQMSDEAFAKRRAELDKSIAKERDEFDKSFAKKGAEFAKEDAEFEKSLATRDAEFEKSFARTAAEIANKRAKLEKSFAKAKAEFDKSFANTAQMR